MSFFSRLFGKGKQEKQKELDPPPKQEELIEEDINYAEENEKRLQAGGIIAFLKKIFLNIRLRELFLQDAWMLHVMKNVIRLISCFPKMVYLC